MSIYSDAVIAIRNHVEARQKQLDAEAATFRAANLAAHRAGALAGVDPASPAYPVCVLVSQTIEVGSNSDGDPRVKIPDATQHVVFAAAAAGMLPCKGTTIYIGGLGTHRYAPGFSNSEAAVAEAWNADYVASKAALSYREENKGIASL